MVFSESVRFCVNPCPVWDNPCPLWDNNPCPMWDNNPCPLWDTTSVVITSLNWLVWSMVRFWVKL
jgi:hypothetical protein